MNGLVNGAKCLAIAGLILFSFSWGQIGSNNSEVQGNWNKYSNKRYADVWGYTAPDGHEYGIVTWTDGMSVVDIEDPNDIKEISFIQGPSSIWHDAKTYRNYCYVTSDQGNLGLQIVDLSELPTRARLVKNVTQHFTVAHNLWIDSTAQLLFAASHGTSRVTVLDISDPENPTYVGRVNGEVHDLWAKDDMLIVSAGRQFNVSFYDISQMKSNGSSRRARTLQLDGGYSHNAWPSNDLKYMCTTEETVGKTLKIYNIENVLTGQAPSLLGEYIADPRIIAHNCYWEGDFVYISHYGAGVRILDLTDPNNPKEVAYHQPGTTNDDFGGSWGLFLWLPSGRVLHADANTGLYVTYPDPLIVKQPWTTPIFDRNGKSIFNIENANRQVINFSLPKVDPYQLSLFNTLGKEIKIFQGQGSEGKNTISWDGENFHNGKYFIRLEQEDATKFGSFILKE